MKPSSLVAAALVLAVASVPLAPAPAALWAQSDSYSDVAPGAHYWLPVKALFAGGVFEGTMCGEGFCPGEPLDRKTMAVWAVRMADRADPEPKGTRFADVDPDSFYTPFIERLAELGITVGCGGARFCPDRTVTRAQAAVMLSRMYRLPDGPDPGFSDVPHDAWYHQEVANLVHAQITVGCGSTRFCPERATTRAHMATFLYRGSGPPRPQAKPVLKWHSAGDSYSSGTGAGPYYDDEHGCKRSIRAYGNVAAGLLTESSFGEWAIGGHAGAEDIATPNAGIAFSACHGHHIEEFFSGHPHGATWHTPLWPRSAEPVDVLTMSFGGNDVGFDTLISELLECLIKAAAPIFIGFPEACKDFLPSIEDRSPTSLGRRIDSLLEPSKSCTGLRYTKALPDRYECDLQLPGGRGGLADFYYIAARDLLTDDGILYVALYPQPFADFEDWPDGLLGRWCGGGLLSPVSGPIVASTFAQLTIKLNDTIKDAVDAANRRLGQTKIIHLDMHRIYRDGAHELCGDGEEWMHGWPSRDGKSLHPNELGHAATGEALAELVAATHPYAAEIADHNAATATYDTALDDYRRYIEALPRVALRSVRVSPGTSAKGEPDCSTDPCKHLVIELDGFSPGYYTVECWSSMNPSLHWNHKDPRRWKWPSALWQAGGCYFGYPGATVWVVVDGVKSNEVIWPA